MCDMKCPFCQQELLLSSYRDGDKDNEIWNCLHCQIGGKRKLWRELIRTRKALGIAVDALKDNLSQANFTQMLDASRFHCIRTRCESALAEIIALEQKE